MSTFNRNTKNILVLGNSGSGKSWLLNQLFCPINVNNEDFKQIFHESAGIETATVGLVEHESPVFLNPKKSFTLRAFDTPGVEDFKNASNKDAIKQKLKSNNMILIIVIKYQPISSFLSQMLYEIQKECPLKNNNTILVINRLPKMSSQVKESCIKLVSSISSLLRLDLYKTFMIQNEPRDIKSISNEILSAIYGFDSLEEFYREKMANKLEEKKLEVVSKQKMAPVANKIKQNEPVTNKEITVRSSNQIQTMSKQFDIILKSEIGNENLIFSPFGNKKLTYVDYTASGRPLSFIEDIVREKVLSNYANTHSAGIHNSEQTSILRDEARELIKKSCNASKDDQLIFVGSGSTSAIHKLIGILNLSKNNRPLVIVSPYEHHSNYLPWKELASEFIYAQDSNDSSLDLQHLESILVKYKEDKRTKIGTFTAASNVTGITLDTNRISSLLHKYGFLSFWDYSTAGPHEKINMNPYKYIDKSLKIIEDKLAYKDAVFFSGHKYLGGPQTPGVLLAKAHVFRNKIPDRMGGGTVGYVTNKAHVYLENREHREEGGTPAIVESIRLGLVFQFKESLDHEHIEKDYFLEFYYKRKGIDFLSRIPNLKLLGNLKLNRYPIFSFLIQNEQTGYYLHHNFITKLLNDLFGIQSRSGCACAGPYGQVLLGITDELASKYVNFLFEYDQNEWRSTNYELFKPGFTRFNLPFFFDEAKVNFVLEAVKFVCEHGWKLLPFYEFNVKNAEFIHKDLKHLKEYVYNHLSDFQFISGFQTIKETKIVNTFGNNQIKNKELSDAVSIQMSKIPEINEAYSVLNKALKEVARPEDQRLIFSEEQNRIRWFLLPSEAYGVMHNNISLYNSTKLKPSFVPKIYR